MVSIKRLLTRFLYTDEQTRLPFKETSIISLLLVSWTMTLTMVYSYLPQMVKSYGIAESEAGRYAGYIGSSLYISQICSSFVFGYLCDVKGKRFMCLVTTAGLGLSTLAFGFSTNFWWALVTRFLQGALNAYLPAKVYLLSFSDDTNQSVSMTLIGIAFATGLVIGPSLSGFLAFPAVQYPTTFSQDSLFGKFPVLLPNLILFMIFVISFCGIYSLPNDKEKYKTLSNEECKEETGEKNTVAIRRSKLQVIRVLFRSKDLLVTTLLYFLLSILYSGFEELYPIWMSTSRKYKGLAFSMSDIGLSLTIPACIAIFTHPFLLPRLVNKFGAKMAYVGSFFIQFFIFLSFPCISIIEDRTTLWAVLEVVLYLHRVMISLSMTCVNVFNNNCVVRQYVGAANGFAMTLSSVARMLGPVTFGSIYSWSLGNVKGIPSNHNTLGFPFNHFFTFIMFALVCALTCGFTFLLPEAINRAKQNELLVSNNNEEKIVKKITERTSFVVRDNGKSYTVSSITEA